MADYLAKEYEGQMTFGRAFLLGGGLVIGGLLTVMAVHLAGDIYKLTKEWLLAPPPNPPQNGV